MDDLFKKLLPVLLLTSCKEPIKHDHIIKKNNPFPYHREQELEFYLDKFNFIYETDTKYISTEFADLEAPAVGYCLSWTTGERKIQIDKTYWNKANYYEKESLLWHELGHCHFNRDHDESLVTKQGLSVPKSIMWPSVIGGQDYYIKNRSYYLKELDNG